MVGSSSKVYYARLNLKGQLVLLCNEYLPPLTSIISSKPIRMIYHTYFLESKSPSLQVS